MSQDEQTREFVQLFARHQRRIYAFIRAQVRDASDADDILQETSAVLWERFAEFDRQADFTRWACGIARRKLFALYRLKQRLRPLWPDELAERYADQLLELLGEEDARTQALGRCLEKLEPEQRELIRLRYQGEADVRAIAARLRRTESAVYKALTKIHDLLLHCIERTLVAEGTR
ncbi:MAG: sigma-70 family RNA polymerase sigma factor [Planctomycetia bacterium]|nr:sigma-70 family RNA polymerase sigma factor [Planctomycetia bacterium]